ncbi:MAG: FKBP-type peptidyl-prolyl cis-trans isomerase [Bacteroidota bacterium]
MQKILISGFMVLAMFLMLSCDESLTPQEQAEVDQMLIEEYVADQGLSGTYTNTGLFIAHVVEGDSTQMPTISDSVTVVYQGELLNGDVFDSSNGDSVTFPLVRLIVGWQEGIQQMGKGGEAVLVIPSAYAYGEAGVGSIPGNSVLRFDITLVDFK